MGVLREHEGQAWACCQRPVLEALHSHCTLSSETSARRMSGRFVATVPHSKSFFPTEGFPLLSRSLTAPCTRGAVHDISLAARTMTLGTGTPLRLLRICRGRGHRIEIGAHH